jgi:hypothetical protein
MYFILTDINNFVYDDYKNCKWKCKTGINTVDNGIFSSINMCQLVLSEIPKGFVYIRCILKINDKNEKRTKSIGLPPRQMYTIHGKVICSDKYYIYDLKTIKKFNLTINQPFVNAFCKDNMVDLLEVWKNSSKWFFDKYDYSFSIASRYGNTDVLEWLKNSGLPFKYNNNAIDNASRNGHVNVLEWWKNSGLELKYSEQSLSFFDDKYYYIDVLEWWKNSGLNMHLFYDSMDLASKNGHIEVLDWWLESNLPLSYCYSEDSMDFASNNGHIEVLDWWLKSNLPLRYSEDSMDFASNNGHIDVLDWWINSKLPLKYSIESPPELDTYDMPTPVLKWWKNSGLLDQ